MEQKKQRIIYITRHSSNNNTEVIPPKFIWSDLMDEKGYKIQAKLNREPNLDILTPDMVNLSSKNWLTSEGLR